MPASMQNMHASANCLPCFNAVAVSLSLQPLLKFRLRDLAVLALLLFLLRFLTPLGECLLRNLARTNPCEAALVLAAVDFQQLVLRVTLHILPHRADLFAGAAAAVEHAAAIFCTAVNSEGKIPAAVLAGAHRNPLPDALAQRKVDQIIHTLRIKHFGELLFFHELKRNLHRLEVKFLQGRSLFIRLHPHGKVDIGNACV